MTLSPVSVMSGKLADRATEAWISVGLRRITLHECRHTYASFLMAAGYTLKELMEFMGHSDLQMVQRYTKLLPQPEEADPAERLDAHLDGRRRGDLACEGPSRLSAGGRPKGGHAVGHNCQPEAVRSGSLRLDAAPLNPRDRLQTRRRRRRTAMPEEGLEPPTRGL